MNDEAPTDRRSAGAAARGERPRRARGARPRARRPRAGQAADPRHRRVPGRVEGARGAGAHRRAAVAAHELHRQPGHRQDDRRHADGGDPASAGLRAQRASRLGDARRPRRPVHRPHGPEDQGSAEARDGRRAVHRRGVLPLSSRERARLRAGGDRDPAAGDGEPARRPRRDPRRLQGPDGHVLPQQSRDGVADRPPHRLPRLQRGRALRDRRADARQARLPARRGGRGRAAEYIAKRRAQPNFANARSIRNALDRARLRQANRLFAAGTPVTRDALQTISAADIRASRVFQGG